MRRELSRLSTSLELFIRLPYSRSSKASNPCLPRWRTDSEADRRVGCKAVQTSNALSMTGRFTFTTVSATLSAWGCKTKGSRSTRKSRLARKHQFEFSGRIVFRVPRCSKGGLRLSGLPPKLTLHPAHDTVLVFLSSDSPGSLNGTLCCLSTCGDRSVRVNLHRTSSPAVYKQIQEEFM